jgi:hypothetical protein
MAGKSGRIAEGKKDAKISPKKNDRKNYGYSRMKGRITEKRRRAGRKREETKEEL